MSYLYYFHALFGSAVLIEGEQCAMKMHSVRILSLPILLDFGHSYPEEQKTPFPMHCKLNVSVFHVRFVVLLHPSQEHGRPTGNTNKP